MILAGCDSGASGGGGSGNDPFSNGGGGQGGDYFPGMLKPGGGGNTGGVGMGGPGDTCGLMKFGLDKLPGQLLLVLDRSGSMRETPMPTPENPNPGRKWDTVTDAIDEVIRQTQASVGWGLKLYPTMSQCGGDGPVIVGVGVNQHGPIMGAIDTNAPERNGATPTRGAVETATAYMKTLTSPNPKFILLATDGQPNCLGGNPAQEATDEPGAVNAVAAAAAAGFPVFVMGIAMNGQATAVLNEMAVKGGRPRAGATKHYPATSRAELVAAMSDIAGQVVSCTLHLNTPPSLPNDTAVDADGKRVPRDTGHQNGWDYGAGNTSVQVYGSWCENLKNGTIKEVFITYGCAGMPIP